MPIIFEDQTLGVIDSEHPQAGFFTEQHLNILVTLASLAGPRIAFIQASEKAIFQKQVELQKSNAELRQAKKLAEQLSSAKSEFIYRMSHELRTPLNAIIGYAEMLIEELSEVDRQEEMLDDLTKVEFSAKYLLQLINNILDISKIEANEMKVYLREESIGQIIKEAEISIRPLIEKSGSRFVVENHTSIDLIRTDGQKLKQILINLLSNASKFTENGTIFLIASTKTTSSGTDIQFEVKDTGIGISL